jgi:metal-responsive CopG/Arc/MetJ family transcriptional regulator
MAKIKIDSNLFNRVKHAAEAAGYSSVEEFITHIIEKELAKYENDQADEKVADQLRGLGYIE